MEGLKRANEILLAASSFFARELDPRLPVVIQFIDDHKERFGVEPICHVLTEYGCKIAPSTYYAARKRPPSARALRDGRVLVARSSGCTKRHVAACMGRRRSTGS